MNTEIHGEPEESDRPLTRADIEHFLREVGGSSKLNLSGRNLEFIDLESMDLTGINLSNAHLSRANLRRANLSNANLFGADLSNADLFQARLSNAILIEANLTRANLAQATLVRTSLREANLREADLSGSGTDLTGANLSSAVLERAYLREANLNEADLSRADLSNAILIGARLIHAILIEANLTRANLDQAVLERASLRKANLRGAYLRGANLSEADLTGADLSDVALFESEKELLRSRGALGLDEQSTETASVPTLRIRIIEEPLTAHNLTTIISALTELHTKGWLIQQGQFADLMEYVQTHDIRFVEEANLIIRRLTHNSPALIEFFMNPSVAASAATLLAAITAAISTLVTVRIKSKAAEQEREKQQLDIDRQRSENQKILAENALAIAGTYVDTIHPGVDQTARAVAIQAVLPNVLQLGFVKGLELASSAPQKNGREGVASS